MPSQTITAQLDQDAEYTEYFKSPGGVIPVCKPRKVWRHRKVTFCGVTKRLEE
jgi:hypothetical protein